MGVTGLGLVIFLCNFSLKITSPPGTQLADQEVEITYKDRDGNWVTDTINIGEQGLGKAYVL